MQRRATKAQEAGRTYALFDGFVLYKSLAGWQGQGKCLTIALCSTAKRRSHSVALVTTSDALVTSSFLLLLVRHLLLLAWHLLLQRTDHVLQPHCQDRKSRRCVHFLLPSPGSSTWFSKPFHPTSLGRTGTSLKYRPFLVFFFWQGAHQEVPRVPVSNHLPARPIGFLHVAGGF